MKRKYMIRQGLMILNQLFLIVFLCVMKAFFCIKPAHNSHFPFRVHCQLYTDRMVVWPAHFNGSYVALLARFLWTDLSPATVLAGKQIG